MSLLSVLSQDGPAKTNADPGWTRDKLLSLHRAMVRSRVLDSVIGDLQRRGVVSIHTPAHGHEAHIYAPLLALRQSDWLFADTRQGAAALYRGFDLRAWLAQLVGGATAAHLGHATASEFTARAVNFVSVSSPVGTQIIHASGTAQGMKAKGVDDISFVWFGPAAAASGDFHVGLNFAGVYDVPAVFYYASSGDAAKDAERIGPGLFIDRAEGYGVRGVRVDGSDVFAVYAAVADAAARARRGHGPTLIEGVTGGPDGDQDPLARLEAYMSSQGFDPGPTHQRIATAFDSEVRGHLDSLLAEPPPGDGTLFDHVFVDPTPQLDEQRKVHLVHRQRFASGVVD